VLVTAFVCVFVTVQVFVSPTAIEPEQSAERLGA
jgi:hypothetical protein